jgi:hypothetical protein
MSVQECERADDDTRAAPVPALLLAGEDEDEDVCAREPHICRGID